MYFALVEVQRIAISVSVCLFVCIHISKTWSKTSRNYLYDVTCYSGSDLLWGWCNIL